jgi:predicted Rossmann fold nucleotide-binding protein DprA/Smf involved in DNA uptake
MLGAGARPLRRTGPPLDDEPARVLAAVDAGATNADTVAAAIDVPAGRVAAALARLELFGYVAATPIGTFTRTLLAVDAHDERRLGSTDG